MVWVLWGGIEKDYDGEEAGRCQGGGMGNVPY